MPWIKIFISHSTKTEEAQEFLDAVKNVLDQDFDLRLDQISLEGGDDWRAQIYRWMYEAHGAVLLLTKEALQSKFVQMETDDPHLAKFSAAGVRACARFGRRRFGSRHTNRAVRRNGPEQISIRKPQRPCGCTGYCRLFKEAAKARPHRARHANPSKRE